MVTVLAVRHADNDLPPDDKDPDLNTAGRRRAETLARKLGTTSRVAPAAAALVELGVHAVPVIGEAEVDNLFVATLHPAPGATLLALRYGEPTPPTA